MPEGARPIPRKEDFWYRTEDGQRSGDFLVGASRKITVDNWPEGPAQEQTTSRHASHRAHLPRLSAQQPCRCRRQCGRAREERARPNQAATQPGVLGFCPHANFIFRSQRSAGSAAGPSISKEAPHHQKRGRRLPRR